MALAMLDMDRFNSVNDTYGHPTGDKVLKGLAAHLVKSSRQSDLVVRWGGEEFVILYPKATAKGAAQAFLGALKEFREMHFEAEDGTVFQVTYSAGVLDVDAEIDIEEAVSGADHLLYLAKEAGRNMVLSHEDADSPVE